jgi:hypothetical protein
MRASDDVLSGIIQILLIRVEDGLGFSTLIKKQKDYVITLNSLKPQKWIPHFITDSIQK